MDSLPQIELTACRSAEYLALQQLIADAATSADDTLDLTTAFLIVKEIRYQSLQQQLEPVTLTHYFLHCLGEPYSSYLSSQHCSHSWFNLSDREARKRITDLLTQGVSAEIPVFDSNALALSYTNRLIQFIGEPYTCFSNIEPEKLQNFEPFYKSRSGFSVFRVGHCCDEGVVLISPKYIGLLWFLGYD
ncbi:MAG TPA: hypothetical protein V6C63_08700 [Allocoleopsis sp.]